MEHRCLFKTLGGANFSRGRAKLHMKINELEGEIVHVVRSDNFSYELLLGLDAIRKFKLIQDENLNILQRVENNKLTAVLAGNNNDLRKESDSRMEERKKMPQNVIQVCSNEYINVADYDNQLDHLSEERKNQILSLLDKFENVFATDKFDIATVTHCEAEIKLLEDRYVAKKPYRCSIPDQEEIEAQISRLLQRGLIEESSSPFASPVTLAYKEKEGRRSRLCIDFRELNKLVVSEPQPFPRIEDIVVKAGNCQFFSTLDINSAFWSIPICERDKMKTAFVTQHGHFQWTCLPFGLKVSPAIFQRALSTLIRKNKLNDFCVNYIDDILVFSKTFEEHLRQIELLIEALKSVGFKLKLSKCYFAKSSVKYIGHVIEKNGIRPAKDNLRAIREFERPKTKKNVRQLLGKINFYYKYIKNASKLLEPLHNLLRKGSNFVWTDECERSFQEIKEYLCSGPVLSIYDQNKPVFIYTHASGEGLGAVLKQPQEDGMLHPVAYFSRRLKPAELKRKAIHLECLAIKQAMGNIGLLVASSR